jgi:hypothetical protein
MGERKEWGVVDPEMGRKNSACAKNSLKTTKKKYNRFLV